MNTAFAPCFDSLNRTVFRLLIAAFLFTAVVTSNADEGPTNVLFIYVEDLGYYTSERAAREPNTGISGLDTPNLDRLASQSVVFTRAFCGQSVCSPSKGAIYSGLAPHANGIWRNVFNRHAKRGGPENWIPLPDPLTAASDPSNTGVGGMHEDIPTMIEKLKAADVYCALSGKLHVQPARKFPYDRFVEHLDLDRVIAEAGEKPWLFWCNPGDTHAPFWKSVQSKLTNPKDRNSAPTDVDPVKIGMPPWLPDTPASRIDLAQYYSNVRNIDAFVGEMMARLEASGQADRTLVVFTGDHGIPVQRGKTSIYPAGTQVPLFIKGPGVETGRIIDTPVSQMDFNPTFLEAFGVEAEPNCQGKSLWPILSGKENHIPNRKTILTETNNSFMSSPGNKGDSTMARAVCDGRFYYIGNLIQETTTLPEEEAINIGTGHGEYGDPGPQYAIDLHDETVRNKDDQPLPYELLRQLCMSDAPAEELYDLDADPWAVNNLIDAPAHADTLARMREEFADWRAFSEDADVHPKTIARRAEPSVGGKYDNLFNGRDLTGWSGLDGFWSVENGAIVGQTSKDKPIEANTFLIWQGGEVADFEFVAQVRFKGVNSGVQYRSAVLDAENFVLSGYQMDLHPDPRFYGMLYGEKYGDRGKIATRGQRIEIGADGEKEKVGSVGDKSRFTDWEWNTVRIVAIGSRLIHQVNGVTTIDVMDHDPSAIAKGMLGLQLHKGGPMRVEFKDLKLRALAAADAPALLKEFASAGPAPAKTPAKPKGKRKGKAKPKKSAENEEMDAAEAEESGASPTGGAIKLNRLKVAKGFKVEQVYEVPREHGSWVSLTKDDKGRFLASDQGDKGLFRLKLPTADEEIRVEKMPVDISGAQGMVWKDGELFFMQSGVGIHRITDSDGDDRFDHAELLSSVSGHGEHGTHGLLDAEDGTHIFAVAGNQTPLPTAQLADRRRLPSWEEDLLLPRQWDPRGHARGVLAPGGWISLFDPETKQYEVFAMGFRNEYDAALNARGDLFTYDADMEWDFGMPWYRPTRICHVVSGADFGWRSGSGKSPTYYEDTTPPLAEIGPGSPSGVVSGRGAKFPAKYQEAIYALDWTYGRVLAVHAQPEGAGYKAEVEDFLAGPAFPVTDAVVGKDGALYLTTGGRGAASALLRVTYTGNESTEPATRQALPKEAMLRRELENFHGVVNTEAVAKAWSHLSSPDRFLRNAARVAVESQPLESWYARVFTEADTQARITAAVALARSGTPAQREALTKCLLELDIASLPRIQQLGVLRALSLNFTRLGHPNVSERASVIAALDPLFPGADADMNSELLQMLVYLNAPDAVAKGMKLITTRGPAQAPSWATNLKTLNARYGAAVQRIAENPPPTAALRYAFALRNARTGWTPELREQFFTFLNEAGEKAGGASYPGYLANIREEALTLCTDAERLALKGISGRDFNPVPDFPIVAPKGPGRVWTLEEAVAATDKRAKNT